MESVSYQVSEIKKTNTEDKVDNRLTKAKKSLEKSFAKLDMDMKDVATFRDRVFCRVNMAAEKMHGKIFKFLARRHLSLLMEDALRYARRIEQSTTEKDVDNVLTQAKKSFEKRLTALRYAKIELVQLREVVFYIVDTVAEKMRNNFMINKYMAQQ